MRLHTTLMPAGIHHGGGRAAQAQTCLETAPSYGPRQAHGRGQWGGPFLRGKYARPFSPPGFWLLLLICLRPFLFGALVLCCCGALVLWCLILTLEPLRPQTGPRQT